MGPVGPELRYETGRGEGMLVSDKTKSNKTVTRTSHRNTAADVRRLRSGELNICVKGVCVCVFVPPLVACVKNKF